MEIEAPVNWWPVGFSERLLQRSPLRDGSRPCADVRGYSDEFTVRNDYLSLTDYRKFH